jgi:membrane protein implicated in regulation of membrane protease activity
MNIVFWVFFGVGIGFTVISFLLGEVFNLTDFDFDLDFAGTVSPLKSSVISAFVTVFGGSGLLLSRTHIPIYGIIPLAGLLGVAVAFLIYRFVVVPLSKAQNTSAVEIQSLVGHKAKVTEKIFQGGFGQITYYVNGNTYNSPAKAENGGEIQRGAGVEIIYIQDNTYFVRER